MIKYKKFQQENHLNLKFISLIVFIFFSHTVSAANAEKNTNMVKAVQGTLKGLTANPPPDRNYKKGLNQIRYTFDEKMVKDCTFIKKVLVTDEDFINLPEKNCEEMIQRMSYDKSYNSKNILLFEFVPLTCTNRNFTGQLFRCD
jgi:hypothetical protein